jgi:hypothetical protein
MSSELATHLASLAIYVAVASGVTFLVWRLTRRLHSPSLRLTLRAFTLAFLFAPGAVACGGATITPFSMVVLADAVGVFSPNGCGPYTPWNLVSFVTVVGVSAIVLFFAERRRRLVVAL